MRNGYRVIDGDGHMQEPLDIWDKYVEKDYYDRRPLVSGHVARYLFEYEPCEAFPEGRKAPRPESVFADCEEQLRRCLAKRALVPVTRLRARRERSRPSRL